MSESKREYNFAEPSMSGALTLANTVTTKRFEGHPISCLEIGVYDGRSACWLLDNILTHPQARYTGIDYIGSHIEAHERARVNLEKNHPGKYRLIIGDSLKMVPACHDNQPLYDIIQIDGCHSFEGCLGDIRNCWPLLKPGGVMICDDYYRADYGVCKAIHTFLATLQAAQDYRIDYVGNSFAWTKLETSR